MTTSRTQAGPENLAFVWIIAVAARAFRRGGASCLLAAPIQWCHLGWCHPGRQLMHGVTLFFLEKSDDLFSVIAL